MKAIFRSAVALIVLAAAAPVTPAGADTSSEERVYFHCDKQSTTRIGNLDLVLDDRKPHWDDRAPGPAGPEQGCAFVTGGTQYGLTTNTIYSMNTAGDFIGALDSLTVHFYAAFAGQRSNSGVGLRARTMLVIDGKSMFGADAQGRPVAEPLTVDATPTGTPGLWKLDYSITDLAIPDDGVHEIQFTVNLSLEVATLYPYDTAETPAGITFNPNTPAKHKFPAKTPGL